MSVTKLAYACPGSFNPDWKNLLSVQNKSALSLGGVAPAIRLLRKFNSETFGLLTVEDVEAALNACVSVRDWETLISANF